MGDTVNMTVTDGYAVYADGRQGSGGSTVEVPAELAEQWQRAGWVVPQPAKASARRRPAR